MAHSIIEAIRAGDWDFEPREKMPMDFHSTAAMPGTVEKIGVLAARIEQGLPLWHPNDRLSFQDADRD